MSQLTVLSDAELDAVSGGSRFLNAGAGGAGGTGGSAVVGGAVQTLNGGNPNLSVNNSTTNAWEWRSRRQRR